MCGVSTKITDKIKMRTALIILSILIVSLAYSQNQNDIIVKHNGEHLVVKVISVDEKITYTFPNETVVTSLGKYCVKEIIFSSGRIQQITEKIIVAL